TQNPPQYRNLETYLKALRLPAMAKQNRRHATEAAQNNLTHEQFLVALMAQEMQNRDENTRKNRIQQARFPVQKALSQFDFTALPNLNKALVLKLAQGAYLSKAENIVFLAGC